MKRMLGLLASVAILTVAFAAPANAQTIPQCIYDPSDPEACDLGFVEHGIADDGPKGGEIAGLFSLVVLAWIGIALWQYGSVEGTARSRGDSPWKAFFFTMMYGPMWRRMYQSDPELLKRRGFRSAVDFGDHSDGGNVIDRAAAASRRAPARAPDEPQVRLRKLGDLLAKGVITKEEHDERRAEIIDDI